MRIHRLLPVLLVFAVGCDGDGTTGPDNGPPLTEIEAIAMFDGTKLDPTGASYPTVIHSSSDSLVVGCTGGGRIRVTGRVMEEPGENTLVLGYDYMIAHSDCQFDTEVGTFTVNSSNLRDRVTVTITGFFTEVDINGGLDGTLMWQLEDRRGTCNVDLALSLLDDRNIEEGLEVLLSGSLCDYEVEIEATLPLEDA